MWHGVNWTDVTVVETEPVRFCSSDEGGEWSESKPEKWRPTAVLDNDIYNVVFYGTAEHVQRRVIRLADTFEKHTYQFETRYEVIWAGPGGFIY
jgi:hypothetical protein